MIEKVIEYWLLLAILTNTFLMAVFRTKREGGKVDWLEAGMCSFFSYGVWFALGWLGLPEGVGVLVGGFFGYKGTHWISNFLGGKFGDTSKDKQDNEE